MNELLIYSLVMVIAVFASSCSQILLKNAADRQYKNLLSEYLNIRVIAAYILFIGSAGTSMFVLRYIPLSLSPVIESSGYIFVAVLSYYILKERITKRKGIGILLIILGTILFMFDFNFI